MASPHTDPQAASAPRALTGHHSDRAHQHHERHQEPQVLRVRTQLEADHAHDRSRRDRGGEQAQKEGLRHGGPVPRGAGLNHPSSAVDPSQRLAPLVSAGNSGSDTGTRCGSRRRMTAAGAGWWGAGCRHPPSRTLTGAWHDAHPARSSGERRRTPPYAWVRRGSACSGGQPRDSGAVEMSDRCRGPPGEKEQQRQGGA